IRDFHVTGVQTCALPILLPPYASTGTSRQPEAHGRRAQVFKGEDLDVAPRREPFLGRFGDAYDLGFLRAHEAEREQLVLVLQLRSEERRGGKGCRTRWSA